MLLALVQNANQTPRMRAIGLRYLPTESLSRNGIEQLLSVRDTNLQRDVVFSLQTATVKWRDELLREIAADARRPIRLRMEAVSGLATRANDSANANLLLRLTVSKNWMLRIESLRALRGQASENAGVRTALLRQVESGLGDAKDGNTQFETDEQLVLALADVDDGDRPSLQSLRARVQRERPDTLDA